MVEKDYKFYLDYFLNKFKNIKGVDIQNVVDRNDINLYISRLITNNKEFVRELGIKLDEETISFFGDFIPDYYVDEFDNTWKKHSKTEVLQILDENAEKYLNVINNGYSLIFMRQEEIVGEEDVIIKTHSFKNYLLENKRKLMNCEKIRIINFVGEEVANFDFKTIRNSNLLESEKINKILN